MLRLLSIEIQKLRYNRSARVISIIYFVLITFIALIASIEFNIGKVNFRVADQGIFNFPFIWHFNTYMAAILKIFLAIVIVSMTSNEYSYRTLKQNLIDGLSKREFVLSKFITVIGFALISTLFVFIVSMILGLSFSDYTELGIIFSDMEYLLAYFVKLMGFFAFCLFLGVWVKRSAFAIGFLVVWWIVESILYALMKWQFFKGTDIAENVAQFFPLTAMSNLIKEPFSRLGAVQSAANQLGEAFTKTYEVGLLPLAIVLVWTFLFVYWSYALLKRRDL
ncbi:MAG TPA: ABC transporter permease [Flavobacteriaceae bacterium]|mgnify:CR=1 FL=1|jgi:ABC-type transport system involved in multi-copper enzyme maturation permease subunit|nr:ABC transporter permease [Flavobacteriaceae bacterium]MAY52369.1 ABC transporter permease [Flavobacteriaceae bacterium]HBR53152.1 ABC transporter permease [Flavobacteriaceae bacterium]HIB48616.1 ABC transporter permease [Flavobacteriaceae bacterium]HIN97940.1 ABC transporter permease [Flavobacteriaceae bacterium]|tara:strand:+ start:50064 stop:50900 length:837 start_codon:yes stop_codon:yes gene_type:complete